MKVKNVSQRTYMVPGALLPGHTMDLPEELGLKLCTRHPSELVQVAEAPAALAAPEAQAEPVAEPAPEAKRRRKH